MSENIDNTIDSSSANDTAAVENTKWYVLRVVNGKEKKVKEYLDKEVKISGWAEAIPQILCPVEKVFSNNSKTGKKIARERILYPGYLLLEGVTGKFNDTMIQAITVTNGVVHFLGKEHPTPLRKAEVNKMFGNLDEISEKGVFVIDQFSEGEIIKIVDGPFSDFNGQIAEVNVEKRKLKVVVKIFGRDNPVELNYTQVEKIA